MTSREKFFKNILLVLVPFLQVCSSFQISSCIRYETYLVTEYKYTPLDFSDDWLSHSFHFTPRRLTRVGLRTKRLYGCCQPGYQYQRFSCQPICSSPCPKNSYCSEPGQCTCYNGYHNVPGSGCVPNELTTGAYYETTTAESTTTRSPCNDSCGINEECSVIDDICICKKGFQKSNTSAACVPKCEPICQHADCTAPNTCNCWPHYERTNDSSCHLKCNELSCIYGECDENGTCICGQGFLNNGTACVWAGDAILSEPDSCDCWSRYVWQTNKTESNGQQCLPLCDGDDSIELHSGCIKFRDCQCYEGFLVCHKDIYKCSTLEVTKFNAAANVIVPISEKVALKKKSSMKLILVIILIISLIIVTLGLFVWIWQKRRNWLTRLLNYNQMENDQEHQERL